MKKINNIVWAFYLGIALSGCASATATTAMLRNQTQENLAGYRAEMDKTKSLQGQRQSLTSKLSSLKNQLGALNNQAPTDQNIEKKIRLTQEITEYERQLVILNTSE